jgi:hypothetical protein
LCQILKNERQNKMNGKADRVSRFALSMDRSLSLAMDPGLRQDDEQGMTGIVRAISLLVFCFLPVIPAQAGIHRRHQPAEPLYIAGRAASS